MSFDWQSFLDQNNIPYVTHGPNVATGNLNIKCPFCGESDPSEHMGINLDSGYWGCWRSSDHRGRRPEKLIQSILKCSFRQAQSIAGTSVRNLSKLDSIIAQIKAEPMPSNYNYELELPKSFSEVSLNRGFLSARKIIEYLETSRGFHDGYQVCKDYRLLYSTEGMWSNRVIMPITINEKLVCWTGRSILPNAELRYLSLSHKKKEDDLDKNKLVAVMNIKDTVWNYDQIKLGGKLLYLVEGPLDALKLDFYSKIFNIRATCLFNNQISDNQAVLISGIKDKYKEIRILFDDGALTEAMKMNRKMTGMVSKYDTLPKGIKDPGDMRQEQIIDFLTRKKLLN